MRLRGIKRSSNVEMRGGRRRSTGAKGGLGVVGVLAVLAIGYFTGIDVSPLLQGGSVQQTEQASSVEGDNATADFSAKVLTTTEAVWTRVFQEQLGRTYTPPTLVIFNGVTQSPCGNASGATGPFYCPADNKAYLDTQFFTALDRQMGAGGDFAAAYVIAHEVAHHVQNQLIWARNVQGLMERGDLEEALNAARMIGDDHLQSRSGRVPQPHTFTHGTSDQRAGWFARGYDTGDVGQCDTFAAARL